MTSLTLRKTDMDTETFKKEYSQIRNGCNKFYHHWFVKSFHYSDGVKACADAGCRWMLEIAATEIPNAMRKHNQPYCRFSAHVKDAKGHLQLTPQSDAPPIWRRSFDFIDMPDGEYVFEVVNEGDRVAMILITEH
jgi:hypothetical protein